MVVPELVSAPEPLVPLPELPFESPEPVAVAVVGGELGPTGALDTDPPLPT
ncbi:MAG: hypothetical protein ACYC0H_09415 [Solirubrobacteraceae bacterium]